jgi:hypothetical protein
MAVLLSATSGLWSDPNTWRVVEPISFANNETSGTTLTTTFLSSATFSPSSNTTLEGLAVKISSRPNAPSGTMSVRLLAAGNAYSGTEVTINTSDIPLTSFSTPTSFYWCYFKFANNVSMTAGVTYAVQARTSVISQVSLGYSVTPTTNWIRALVTTATAVPSSTDTMIVVGPFTSPDVSSSNTVTFNNTTNTIYGGGAASFSSIEVGRNGILNFQTNSSTNYQLISRGNVNIGGGGVFTIGTSGSPIPSGSTATLQFTMSSANQFQLNVRQFGNFYTYGATKSARALLGSNASAGVSSITTSTSTNWNQNDYIVIAPTTNSSSAFDARTMSAAASGTSITLTATLSNAKTIWANTECEIINLTRNVRILGMSSSFDCIHTYNGFVQIDVDYTEFNFGVWSNSVTDATSGSLIKFTGCSFWGSTSRNLLTDANVTTGVTVSFDDCVLHNFTTFITANNLVSSSQSSVIFTDLWAIRASSTWMFPSANNSFTMNRCRWIASAAGGLHFGNNGSYNTGPIIVRDSVFKCCQDGFFNRTGAGAYTTIGDQHDISNNKFYLNSRYGFVSIGGVGVSYGWIIGPFEAFSNATVNVFLSETSDLVFLGATLYGGPTQTSPVGIQVSSTLSPITFNNFHMSTHSTADVVLTNNAYVHQLNFRNSSFNSTTEVSSPTTTLSKPSYIYSARHDQTDGNHVIWYYNGRLSSDPSIYRTSPRSLRITPLSSSNKIQSTAVLIPVEMGKSINVGVWVRRSVSGDGAAHNGNFPRLICKVNTSTWAGITDFILATSSSAADGSWEYISGTSPVAVDDSAYEVVVDTDGTAGWVNVDDMFISKQNSTKGFKYWSNASPVPSSTTNNGSSVIFL